MNISVIITTYNRFDLARRAINSVANQTYRPFEIIVIEDASSTGIGKWIRSNHPSIKFIKNKINLGLAGSRNVGIKASNGSWIAFLDDDDEWLPTRLEAQIKYYHNLDEAVRNNLACMQVGNEIVNENDEVISIKLPSNDGKLNESIKKIGANTPSSAFLFRKTALVRVGGFDEDLVSGIDHDIWMKLAVADYSVKALQRPLVRIYQDRTLSMMTNTENRIEGIQQYVEKWSPTYKNWFGKKEGEQYAKEYFIEVITRLAGKNLAYGKFKDFSKSIYSIKKNIGLDLIRWAQVFLRICKVALLEKHRLS